MSKVIDISKLLKAINQGTPKSQAIKAYDDTSLNCEECGIYTRFLNLSNEGFFHCEECHKIYLRAQAVQAFDID